MFFIKVYGCQYNEWDAARLAFELINFGLSETDKKEADIIFILMCSVRQTAVDRVYSEIHNYPNKKIVICGCVLDADRKKFEKRGALIWDGKDFDALARLLNLNYRELLTTNHQPLTTDYLPIMTGCNNFCSYCAVPHTRGREKSRPMKEVLADVKKIIDSGAKEVLLLGQNVNSYHPPVISSRPEPTGGWIEGGEKSYHTQLEISNSIRNDKKNYKAAFAILLEEICNIPGNFKVSFTSNHPKDMTDDIIEAIATLPKIEKSIHLPLQSGSNKILKAMNRPYTREQYLALVEKIKAKIPNIKLTTDTIVGFPGETEEDFQETVNIFKEVGYFQAFDNKYSPREGTKAYALGDPIPWSEKERRWRILNEITNKKN